MRRAGFQIPEKDGSALVPGNPSHRNTQQCRVASSQRSVRGQSSLGIPGLLPSSDQGHSAKLLVLVLIHSILSSQALLSSNNKRKRATLHQCFARRPGSLLDAMPPGLFRGLGTSRIQNAQRAIVYFGCKRHAVVMLQPRCGRSHPVLHRTVSKRVGNLHPTAVVDSRGEQDSLTFCHGDHHTFRSRPSFPVTPASSLHPWLSFGDFRGPGHGKGWHCR